MIKTLGEVKEMQQRSDSTDDETEGNQHCLKSRIRGYTSLEGILKAHDTIDWYLGKCSCTNRSAFGVKVISCLAKRNHVSFEDDIDPLMKYVTGDTGDITFLQMSLAIACHLLSDEDAVEAFKKCHFKKVFHTDKVQMIIEEWTDEKEQKPIFWREAEGDGTRELRWQTDQLISTFSALIDDICSNHRLSVNTDSNVYVGSDSGSSISTIIDFLANSMEVPELKQEFSVNTIQYYFGDTSAARCMISDVSSVLKAVQILPSDCAKFAEFLGLTPADFTTGKNGLLLEEGIAHKFYVKDLTFMWHVEKDRIYCVVLDPVLRKRRKFANVHGKRLNIRGRKKPFRRLLVQHSFDSLKKWEKDEEKDLGNNARHKLETSACKTHIKVSNIFLLRPEHFPGWPWLLRR